MHLTRKNSSNLWPIEQKSTKYVIVPSHAKNRGMPLLIIMRDVLGLIQTRRELKKILLEEKVLVNNKVAKEENLTLQVFDTLNLKVLEKFYKLTFSKVGKFALEEISEKDTAKKIAKVINKKILDKGKMQINLNDGRNILSDEKISVGDSVLVDFKSNKIEKVLHLEEKSSVMIIEGKHKGKSGVIVKVEEGDAVVKAGDREIKIDKDKLIVLLK